MAPSQDHSQWFIAMTSPLTVAGAVPDSHRVPLADVDVLVRSGSHGPGSGSTSGAAAKDSRARCMYRHDARFGGLLGPGPHARARLRRGRGRGHGRGGGDRELDGRGDGHRNQRRRDGGLELVRGRRSGSLRSVAGSCSAALWQRRARSGRGLRRRSEQRQRRSLRLRLRLHVRGSVPAARRR